MDKEQLRLILGGALTDGEPIEALLEHEGRLRLLEGRVDLPQLDPWLDELAELDLRDRPDAALLVATLLYQVHRLAARAFEQAEHARAAYEARNDHAGLAQATLMLGHLAWWQGDTAAAADWWDQAGGLPVDEATPAGLAPFRVASDLIVAGHLSQAVDESHHAYAITVAEGSAADEAHATLFGGLVTMDTGRLDTAVDMLERADDLFAEIAPRRDAALWPGVNLGLGEIAARRGEVDRALEEFATAARRAVEFDRPALAAMALAMPALHLTGQTDGDFLPAAEAADRDLHADEQHWFALQVVERARATAYLADGDAQRALELAEATAAGARNALLQAKALLLVARARRALGRDDALEALDDAIATFLDEGADLWAVEALIERADLDPATASSSLDQAYARTGDDRAFVRLWQHRPRLTVELSGQHRPVFRVGSDVLPLGAKGERLAEVVVHAGDAGIHWETVAARLWPDEDDADRIKSRLTSLTALVRGRLGPDGWRLRRDGPRFRFVSLAADIVIVTDESAPARALMSL